MDVSGEKIEAVVWELHRDTKAMPADPFCVIYLEAQTPRQQRSRKKQVEGNNHARTTRTKKEITPGTQSQKIVEEYLRNAATFDVSRGDLFFCALHSVMFDC